MHDFLRRLGIEHPIILAPMAGGPGTPELAAAVSNAGGLGSLGLAYLKAETVRGAIRQTRTLTGRPINVNLFAGGRRDEHVDPKPMLAIMSRVHERLGLGEPVLPPLEPDPFGEEVEAVLEMKPEVFSFTFGIPEHSVVEQMHDAKIIVMGTATTVEEGRALAAANVDAIVAQGGEAGAHRGTFIGPFEDAMVPALDLVEQIVREVSIPVIAAGGLMDGRDIAAALNRGAAAAQLGTAFLSCPESGASAAYRRALLDARRDTTVITRAFSGRPARGLRNEFIEMVTDSAILPFPLQNSLTRPMRAAAAAKGEAGFLSLWAGRGVARSRAIPAAELVRTLVAELNAK